MKSHREQMIDALVDAVKNWDEDALFDFAQQTLFDRYSKWKTSEIEDEYTHTFGIEDCPETFDGYNEP
jgi:hypothetical protein